MEKESEKRKNIVLDITVDSDSTQRALPDLKGLTNTYGFDAFMVNPPSTVTSEPGELKRVLKNYAIQLERHERSTQIWEQQSHNSLFSLRTFLTEFNTKCGHISKATAKLEFQSGGVIQESDQAKLARQLEHIGTTEFEDLYYLLAAKTRHLYHDLQIRFASNFLTLNDKLNNRGPSSYDELPCTVRDMRNLLRAIWFHLLHPKVIQGIETAIHARKYKYLQANPLLPASYYRMSREEQFSFNERFRSSCNIEDSPLRQMFEHLEDVSTMSTPAILNKLWVRRNGSLRPATEKDDRRRQETYEEVYARSSFVLLQEDEEDNLEEDVKRTEGMPHLQEKHDEPEFGQEYSRHAPWHASKRSSYQGRFKQEYLKPNIFNSLELHRETMGKLDMAQCADNGQHFGHNSSLDDGAQFKLSSPPRSGQQGKHSQQSSPNRHTYPRLNEDMPDVHQFQVPALSEHIRAVAAPTVSMSMEALQQMREMDPYTQQIHGMAENWPLRGNRCRKEFEIAPPPEHPRPLFYQAHKRNFSPSREPVESQTATQRDEPAPVHFHLPPTNTICSQRGDQRQKDKEVVTHSQATLPVFRPSLARNASHVPAIDKHSSRQASPVLPTGTEPPPVPSDGHSEPRYFRPSSSNLTPSSIIRSPANSDYCLDQASTAEMAKVLPPRTSSKRALSPICNFDTGPTSDLKTTQWHPHVLQYSYQRPPEHSTPNRQDVHNQGKLYKTPSTAIKTSNSARNGHSYQGSPFDRRMTFRSDAQYAAGNTASRIPPHPPPKSEVQLQQAENMREGMRLLQSKIESLERERSMLQEILQNDRPSSALENSTSHEKLDHRNTSTSPAQKPTPSKTSGAPSTKTPAKSRTKSPATPASGAGGLIRKLGKLGSRSRSKSPRKSRF